MPNSYELADARFTQFVDTESAADALYWTLGPVPTGMLWTLRAVSYNPSVPKRDQRRQLRLQERLRNAARQAELGFG